MQPNAKKPAGHKGRAFGNHASTVRIPLLIDVTLTNLDVDQLVLGNVLTIGINSQPAKGTGCSAAGQQITANVPDQDIVTFLKVDDLIADFPSKDIVASSEPLALAIIRQALRRLDYDLG